MGVGAVLMLLAFAADAPSAPELSDAQLAARAEAAFQEGCRLRAGDETGTKEFQAAAADYEELRRRHIANPALYRNLGHAYVLADDLPQAILAFHSGLRLAPQDAALHESLAAARQLVDADENSLGRPPVDVPLLVLPSFALPALWSSAFICYAGLCICVTRWWMTRRAWLLIVAALCLLILALPTSMLIWLTDDAEQRYHAETDRPLVVIKDDNVLLRKGDSLKYPPRSETPLNRGVEAHLLHERGDWVQIELPGGAVGWVSRNYVLIDAPGAD